MASPRCASALCVCRTLLSVLYWLYVGSAGFQRRENHRIPVRSDKQGQLVLSNMKFVFCCSSRAGSQWRRAKLTFAAPPGETSHPYPSTDRTYLLPLGVANDSVALSGTSNKNVNHSNPSELAVGLEVSNRCSDPVSELRDSTLRNSENKSRWVIYFGHNSALCR